MNRSSFSGTASRRSGKPARERFQRDQQFGACQVLTNALMDAVPESKVSTCVALNVEAFRVFDEGGVEVASRQIHQDMLAGADQLSADLHVLDRDPVDQAAMHDRQVAKQLFDDLAGPPPDRRFRAVWSSRSGFCSRISVPSAIMLAVVSWPACSMINPVIAAVATLISPVRHVVVHQPAQQIITRLLFLALQ